MYPCKDSQKGVVRQPIRELDPPPSLEDILQHLKSKAKNERVPRGQMAYQGVDTASIETVPDVTKRGASDSGRDRIGNMGH